MCCCKESIKFKDIPKFDETLKFHNGLHEFLFIIQKYEKYNIYDFLNCSEIENHETLFNKILKETSDYILFKLTFNEQLNQIQNRNSKNDIYGNLIKHLEDLQIENPSKFELESLKAVKTELEKSISKSSKKGENFLKKFNLQSLGDVKMLKNIEIEFQISNEKTIKLNYNPILLYFNGKELSKVLNNVITNDFKISSFDKKTIFSQYKKTGILLDTNGLFEIFEAMKIIEK